MEGFWHGVGQALLPRFEEVCFGLLIAAVMVVHFQWPLALLVFLISGLLAWHVTPSQYPILMAACLVPVGFSFSEEVNFFVLNYASILLMQFGVIALQRRTQCWSFTIETFSLMWVVALSCIGFVLPQIQAHVVHVLSAQLNALVVSDNAETTMGIIQQSKSYLYGLFGTTCFLEGLCYASIAAWWHNRTLHEKRDTLMTLRLSHTILGVAVLFGLAYVCKAPMHWVQMGLVLFVPFFCAGLSTAIWLYHHSAFRKKFKYSSIIWLIFILLYGTLLPLALAVLGLLDVAVDFRKRAQLKQKQ